MKALRRRLEPLRAQLRELEGLADSFGRAMTTAFRRSVIDGKALDDVLRSLVLSLSSRALNAALAPIGQGIGSLFGGLIGSLFGGASFSRRRRWRDAEFSGGAGCAGVAIGRARRRAQRGVSVVFNVTTPDAQSFRRAEAELGAMLARTVARGRGGCERSSQRVANARCRGAVALGSG